MAGEDLTNKMSTTPSTSSSSSLTSQQKLDIQKQLTDGKNARGIPTVKFIDKVEDFLATLMPGGCPTETALGAFNELYSKYKFMEGSLGRTKINIKQKIPEVEKTLEVVNFLKKKQEEGDAEPIQTHYSLADTIYGKAEVECTGEVCLWLGANVMLKYTYDEAIEVLTNSLNSSKTKLAETVEDLEHLRNQSITVEVNMARLFNYDLKMKKSAKVAPKTEVTTTKVTAK